MLRSKEVISELGTSIFMSLKGDSRINNGLEAKGLGKRSGAFEWPKAFGLRGLMP